MHPALYEGPRMIKPPIVQIAGMLRARKPGHRTDSLDLDRRATPASACSIRRTSPAGTRSAGSTRPASRGRWSAGGADHARPTRSEDEGYDRRRRRPKQAVAKALELLGRPDAHPDGPRRSSSASPGSVEGIATEDWQQESYRALRQNALRMLIATSPDFQTS